MVQKRSLQKRGVKKGPPLYLATEGANDMKGNWKISTFHIFSSRILPGEKFYRRNQSQVIECHEISKTCVKSMPRDCLVGIEVHKFIVAFLPGRVEFLSVGDESRIEGETELANTEIRVGLSRPENLF